MYTCVTCKTIPECTVIRLVKKYLRWKLTSQFHEILKNMKEYIIKINNDGKIIGWKNLKNVHTTKSLKNYLTLLLSVKVAWEINGK